jgi:hypothetical protein
MRTAMASTEQQARGMNPLPCVVKLQQMRKSLNALQAGILLLGCSAGKENIQTKMRLMERMIREQQLAAKKKEADRWYEEKRYAAALKVYNEMLQIDPGNSHAR